MAKMMTIPELATKAGVGARTISDIEIGSAAARPDTIRCIAGALTAPPEDLLIREAPPAAPVAPVASRPPVAASPPIPPPKHPPRTRLDSLAELVRTRGLSSPPVTIGKTTLTVLDPVVMQNLFARHAAFDGDSFVVCGRIERQRALSVAEARALKTRVGVGARYGLVVDVVAGAATETLDVTVHAVDAPVAAALQAKMGQAARVVVRVRVVGKEEARVVSLFASARKRAWALVAVKMA
jgi:transcriptional regulator with XRE-family HTH domain